MNTRVVARPVVPAAVEPRSVATATFHIEFIVPLILCAILAAGAFLAFPLNDDGWLSLALREANPHFLAQHMGDRPVFGFLLERASSFVSANRIVFVLLDAVSWLALAWESGTLFSKLFPELSDYSVLAACLTLAPIVLQTQLTTVLVAIPANLATILGYAAILILFRRSQTGARNSLFLLGGAMALAAAGVALSEYGVATNLVGAAILTGLALTSADRTVRRRLIASASWLFGLTVTAYLLFARFADFNARPDVAPVHVLQRGAGKLMEVPFDVIAGAWHSVIGAYGVAVGNVTLAWDSKSTIVGLAIGVLMAGSLYAGIGNRSVPGNSTHRPERLPLRLALLISALLIGLLPFSVMGRPTTLLEFGSRFRIPIMPVAAAITVAFALSIVRNSLRWVPVVALGFIVGYTSWTFTYTFIQQSRSISALGAVLKPEVAQANGIVVAVVPFNRFETELTANISSSWPVDMEKKLWVVAQDTAEIEFGSRGNCRQIETLNVEVRGLTRMGKLDRLLWVEAQPGHAAAIEPYCRGVN